MNKLLLLIGLILTNFLVAQESSEQVFHKTFIKDVKLIEAHYLIHFTRLTEKEANKYQFNCNKKDCGSGLAYMDSSLQYKWAFTPNYGIIEDFWENEHFIYLLTSGRHNTKVSSEAKLILYKLNKKGKLISKTIVDSAKFDRPNGSFEAKFSKNGLIYKILNIPGDNHIIYPDARSGKPSNTYQLEVLNLNLESLHKYNLSGRYLYLETSDSKWDEATYIFSADSVNINSTLLIDKNSRSKNTPSILLLKFDSGGKLFVNEYIGSGDFWIKSASYQKENLIISGIYSGNDSIPNSSDCYFQGNELQTPNSYIQSNGAARNAFIASINANLNVNWLRQISGDCDILYNSLTVNEQNIAISFNYREYVEIAGKRINGIHPPSAFQYSESMICFFDTRGELTFVEQLKHKHSKVRSICLFPKHTFVHGEFRGSAELFGAELSSTHNHETFMKIFKTDHFNRKIIR